MDHNHHGGIEISPLVVGLLGVMAGALIVATLHCIKVCWSNDGQRTSTRRIPTNTTAPTSQGQNVAVSSGSSSGSFSNVQLVFTSNYSKECKEETCAVCLAEFNEGEEVRVLPECGHIFHVSCIDKWLYFHPNCPLCRTETLPSPRDLVCSHPDDVPPTDFPA